VFVFVFVCMKDIRLGQTTFLATSPIIVEVVLSVVVGAAADNLLHAVRMLLREGRSSSTFTLGS